MARPSKHDGVVHRRRGTKNWWMRYRDRTGTRRQESTGTEDWDEAQRRLRNRLQARDDNILDVVRRGEELSFGEWADAFLEQHSKPPLRARQTHEANSRALMHLKKTFGSQRMAEVSGEGIEAYLRDRLRRRVQVRTAAGVVERGYLKPSTVHQEFRVLRRVMNVAVRKKLLRSNPCAEVEFPVSVRGLFRPHYVSWSEQRAIEDEAPPYLRNVIRVVTETGLRIYKELCPMRKDQLDLVNAVAWIPESKTPTGVAEVPLTELSVSAFRDQMGIAGPGAFLFPSDKNPLGYQKTFKTAWTATLRRAGVPYFRIYDLRSTYATRLSAGGVADEWVTQLLRQRDAQVFKKYSQMNLQMRREALRKLNRNATEVAVVGQTA